MKRIVVTLGPGYDFVFIRGIRINTNHYLRPLGVAIIPGSIRFAHARRGAIDRIHVHGGMHRREGFAKPNVLRNRFIAQLVNKIGAPVPLQPRRIKRIEHTL